MRDRVVLPGADHDKPNIGQQGRGGDEGLESLPMEIAAVEIADGDRQAVARLSGEWSEAIGNTVVDSLQVLVVESGVRIGFDYAELRIGDQARGQPHSRAADPSFALVSEARALMAITDRGQIRQVVAANHEHRWLLQDTREEQRQESVPGSEPAEYQAVRAYLAPHGERIRETAGERQFRDAMARAQTIHILGDKAGAVIVDEKDRRPGHGLALP